MSVSPKGAVTTVQGFAKPASFARARLDWLFEAQHVEDWNEISRLMKVLTKSGKFAETGNSRQSIRRSRGDFSIVKCVGKIVGEAPKNSISSRKTGVRFQVIVGRALGRCTAK